MTHTEAAETLRIWLQDSVMAQQHEFQLPNGRRADICCVTTSARIAIIEIKTTWRASHLTSAWHKYGPWCHHLYVATTAAISINDPEIATQPLGSRSAMERIGILEITNKTPRLVRLDKTRLMLASNFEAISRSLARRHRLKLATKLKTQEVLAALPGAFSSHAEPSPNEQPHS